MRVAHLVVTYLGAVERTPPDDVEAIGRRLAAALAPSPIEVLATHPDIDVAALIRRERLARFEARGCRQADTVMWERETHAILAGIEQTLAERYARLLRA